MKPKIIVAMDDMSYSEVEFLTHKLGAKVWGIKLNDFLLNYSRVEMAHLSDFTRVMADPKLFDIPNTMINSLKVLEKAGAAFVTVHLSAGVKALKACHEATRMELFGITVLTSMDDAEVKDIYNAPREMVVQSLMLNARNAGLDGVVCAADCVELAKRLHLKTIVPGVRLPDMHVAGDDQVHKALNIPDCDYIVVGRPITQSPDPVAAVEKIKALIAVKEEACTA